MVLKKVLIGYHVTLGIMDGDGGDDGSCVVCCILIVAGIIFG